MCAATGRPIVALELDNPHHSDHLGRSAQTKCSDLVVRHFAHDHCQIGLDGPIDLILDRRQLRFAQRG